MSQNNISDLPLPPGNLGLPIIGETLNLLSDTSLFVHKRHQKYGEIFKTHVLGNPTIYITGAEANEFFLTNPNITSDFLPSMKALLGESYLGNQLGDVHKSRRQILYQAFQPRTLNSYFDTMKQIAQAYLERWTQLEKLTWYPELRSFTFDVACKFLIGLDNASATPLRPLYEIWEEGLLSFNTLRLPWTKFGRAWKTRKLLLKEIEQLIKKRQEESDFGSDALGILITAKDEEGKLLSLPELTEQLLGLLFAGHGTLSSALTSFCLLMAQHPEILAKIAKEQQQFDSPLTPENLKQMLYLEQVLKEVLRLIPPVGGGFRKVIQDCEFNGFRIPAGYSLFYQINETHSCPQIYPDPEKFDPEHFSPDKKTKPFEYIPFGGGLRECLGKEFAKLEMKMFAALLVRDYSWSLIPAQDLSFVLLPTPRPQDGLQVEFRALA